MICIICRQAETVNGLTLIHFERGEMKLEVRDVPALVCPGCGEAYVEEAVAERLLHHVEQKFLVGDLNDRQEYTALP